MGNVGSGWGCGLVGIKPRYRGSGRSALVVGSKRGSGKEEHQHSVCWAGPNK